MKAILISVLLLLFSSPSQAGIEIGIGTTHFGKHGDGVWYQESYGPYTLNINSPTLSIGVTGRATDWMKWRAGYQYLGRYSTSCECTSDRAYEELLRGNDVGGPTSTYSTRGDIHALRASLLPETRVYGVPVFAEIGGMVLGASNKAHVENWRPAIDEDHWLYGPPQSLDVDNGRKWAFAPVLGVGARFGASSVAINATRINVAKGLWYPITHGWAWSLELRHEF